MFDFFFGSNLAREHVRFEQENILLVRLSSLTSVRALALASPACAATEGMPHTTVPNGSSEYLCTSTLRHSRAE